MTIHRPGSSKFSKLKQIFNYHFPNFNNHVIQVYMWKQNRKILVLKRHAMRLITVYKKQVNKINSIGSEMAVQNLKLRNVILPLRIVQGLNYINRS